MKLLSLNTVVLALLVLGVTGMIVPTGAVLEGDTDQVWEEPAISLAPAPGPNGQYAEIGPDGNLSVDLSDVNVGSVTIVREVFMVTNNESVPYEIWVNHDGTEAVQFFVDGARSLEDAGNPVVLEPGATRLVSLVIDTRNRSANEVLMTQLTLHAQRVSTPTPTPTPTETSPGSGSGGESGSTPTPTETDEESVEVVFEIETGGESGADEITVREMSVSELNEDPQAAPRAVIGRTGQAQPLDQDGNLTVRASGANAVTEVDAPIHLSGSRSRVGHVAGVDSQQRIVKLVDIQVPEPRQGQPGTVRISVARQKFGDTDPREAMIGHRADDGWVLLDTQVVSSTDRSVTLEARTRGFSPFAVFVRNEVRFTWTLPDGTTVEGREIRSQFDEPGVYNVTLEVTDAVGRADSAVYRVLVNDEPTVTIEGLADVNDDGPTTFRANVTNEFGDVTITWTFADGSTTVGETVNRSVSDGETVRVVVEDEFGAQGRAEGVVGQPPDDGGRPTLGVVQFNLGLQSRIAVVGLAVILLVMGLRWLAARRFGRY